MSDASDVANWLSAMLQGGAITVLDDGTVMPAHTRLNFVGFDVVDDPFNDWTTVTAPSGTDAAKFRGRDLDTTIATTRGQVYVWDPIAAKFVLRQLTTDDLASPLTEVLTFASGGAGPVEIGQTGITPLFNSAPAPNAAGVTAFTIADNLGGGPTNRLGSANGFQGPATTYTAPSTPGTMLWTASVTEGGVTKTGTAGIPVATPYFFGMDPDAGGTAATASGANATLTGGATSATLTGVLASLPVGGTFTFTPSGAESGYLWVAHTTAPMTFTSGAAPFGLSRIVNNVLWTSRYGVATEKRDLYRTDNALTVSYLVKRDT